MKRKFLFGKKWFFEDFLPEDKRTSTWGFVIEKEIYSGKSEFQKIEVFETKDFGRILVLDGEVQLSSKDEFVYHEMLVQPAFLYHQNPKKILIIGGGDGGALREVLKHKVESVFLVDIDEKVIAVSRKYLPSVPRGAFNDKRVKVFNEDGAKFIGKYNNFFDIIIEDLTDPKGPSAKLWNIEFFRGLLNGLNDGGVGAFQSGYLRESFAKKMRKDLRQIFHFFKSHRAFVGCFPFDEHTFSFGSPKIDFEKIGLEEIKEKFRNLELKTRYYSPEIHFVSAVFPKIYG